MPTSPLARKLQYGYLSLAIVVLDQWTKWLVELHLPRSASHPLIDGFLNLTHVQNTGVAFGLFARQGADGGAWLLIVLGVVALAAVMAYFRFAPASARLLLSALALIVGGALGNLIDRFASGAVTDFVDVYVGTHHWPAFNVADSAITIGICLMILDTFLHHHERHEAASDDDEGSGAVEATG
jgi:signal peptidase II